MKCKQSILKNRARGGFLSFRICPFFPNLQEAAGSLALQTSLSPMVWFDRLSGGTDGYTELQAYSSRFLKWQ